MDIVYQNRPHIPVKYAEHKASIDIKTNQLLAGKIPSKKLKLRQKWTNLCRMN
jgi:hypothetical protein